MGHTRRDALLALAVPAVLSAQDQEPYDPRHPHLPREPNPEEDNKLPNGKSQKDEMAKQAHKEALQDAATLLATAQQLHDELQQAGNYVVPVAAVKKTEEIEKLARRIRGRLKA